MMRIAGASFYLLDARLGWREPVPPLRRCVSVGQSGGGIRLAAAAGGPLDLAWDDGSLGGLVLPKGLATDTAGELYLLSRASDAEAALYGMGPGEPVVRAFDPVSRAFVPLPAVGGRGPEPRRLVDPANIAIGGRDLYVADRSNHRVQVFSLDAGLALHHLWTLNAGGEGTEADADDAWDPVDVAAYGGAAYILDARYHRIYRHTPGSDMPDLVVDGQAYLNLACGPSPAPGPDTPCCDDAGPGSLPAGPVQVEETERPQGWSRLAFDRNGGIYVLDAGGPCLQIFNPDGRWLSAVADAGDVAGAFDPPAVRLHYTGQAPDQVQVWFQMPAVPGLSEKDAAGLYFDPEGARVSPDLSLLPGPARYERCGTWQSDWLDSEIYHCQWHRIVFDVANLPLGTQIAITTATIDPDVVSLGDQTWSQSFTFVGGPRSPNPVQDEPFDLLVQSDAGQCLQLKIELRGDGYSTPEIRAIRVYYPRESYLRYLPAIYSADDDARRFLEHFLSIFQTTWDGIEDTIARSARYFDPSAVPDQFQDILAAWLGVRLEQSWSPEQKRNLLQIIPRQNPKRGTLNGLRLYVQAYLQNIAGVTPQEQSAYPLFVEGFRERRYVQFMSTGAAPGGERRLPPADRQGIELDRRAKLWSREFAGRLQLDAYATLGQVRLVSTGDPRRDVFYEHAHRFRVFVPAAWIRTAGDENMLRKALETEKPAHTAYDLRLVEPRMRVGIQSTVGVDTILGGYPTTRLSRAGEDNTIAPALPPRGRLGYDTVLSSAAPAPLRLAPAPGIPAGSVIR